MKSTDQYIDDFLDNYSRLRDNNELWRLNVSFEDFTNGIETIRESAWTKREEGILSEEMILRYVDASIVLLLQDKRTFEEIKKQAERASIASVEHFKRDAPEAQAEIMKLEVPLNFSDVVFIYRSLFRNQITLDMIPEPILQAFKLTEYYEAYLKR